jgi:hypothetical protein
MNPPNYLQIITGPCLRQLTLPLLQLNLEHIMSTLRRTKTHGEKMAVVGVILYAAPFYRIRDEEKRYVSRWRCFQCNSYFSITF